MILTRFFKYLFILLPCHLLWRQGNGAENAGATRRIYIVVPLQGFSASRTKLSVYLDTYSFCIHPFSYRIQILYSAWKYKQNNYGSIYPKRISSFHSARILMMLTLSRNLDCWQYWIFKCEYNFKNIGLGWLKHKLQAACSELWFPNQ
jgi:hypothetical protein